MSTIDHPPLDDVDIVPVPMTAETRVRLARFARATGKDPVSAASELLAELLADDEFWNAAACGSSTQH